MNLKLVKASKEYRTQITEMLDEWYASGEKIIPYTIRRLDYHDFEYYCANLEVKDTSSGLVPESTFFCLDTEQNRFVGAVNIRHYLNDALLKNGGHIGDGVRPSERRKGVATKMIALALEECKKLGIDKVLMVCNKNNPVRHLNKFMNESYLVFVGNKTAGSCINGITADKSGSDLHSANTFLRLKATYGIIFLT